MSATQPKRRTAGQPPPLDEDDLKAQVAKAFDRWPSAGAAVGVVRAGSPTWLWSCGAADITSGQPVTEDTVFRIGSLTKTITAIAVMQLWERGLVGLDAPANDYLRTFRLVPGKPGFRPATIRHLLTHTAGIGYVRRLSDVLHPLAGSGDRARSLSPLAGYYRNGLLVEVEPGTKWVYSNHGFAALGQIVEDVTGQPLDNYLREHIFGPLGMEHTDLARSEHVRSRLATGYVLRSRGLKPVGDYEVPTPGGGGVYSTSADMARYLAALLNMEAHRSVLQPDTVNSMFQPHFRPDPRIPGMGLAFEPSDEGGYHTVRKGGTLSGFLSALTLAPGQGIGVVVLTNTGGLDNRGVAEPLATGLLRRLLDLPGQAIRTGIPPRPDTWGQLCGWYGPDPGPVTNLFLRALFGAGAEVTVRHGHLTMTPLTPVPAMRHGMRLHPDDPDDPHVFRTENPAYGITNRVVFSPGDDGSAGRLFMDLFSLRKRPEARNPRRWVTGLAIAGAAALAARHRRHTPA